MRRAVALLLGFLILPVLLASASAAEPNLAATASSYKPSQRWALLIGVNDYAYINKLKYCGDDMEALRDQLVMAGFPQKQVYLLTDKSPDKKYLPFKTNIEQQLDVVLKLVERDDVLVLAFSGHGVHLGGQSYLCPTDTKLDDPENTLVSLSSVYERIKECRASLKIVLVDACRNDPRPGGKKSAADTKSDNQKFSRPLEQIPQGTILLNSCSPGETSMEDDQLAHGVFTHFLLEGLKGAADDNGDGNVTLAELTAYVGSETKTHVARRWTDLQRPYLKGDLTVEAMRFDFGVAVAKQFTNSLGMKLVLLPAGKFQMGDTETPEALLKVFPFAEKDWFHNAHPRHAVRITKPFYLGAHEVTVGQFRKFVDATGYVTEAERDEAGGWGYDPEGQFTLQREDFNWRNTGVSQSDSHPVVNVTWNDAMAFCEWLSQKEGKKYRLPTEAQWEYACRAGTDTRYWNGNSPEGLINVDNIWDASTKGKFPQAVHYVRGDDGHPHRAPVGSYQSNSFGLHDMHGNAVEWCADWYSGDTYANSPPNDPQGPATGLYRVTRGGGWNMISPYCRAAYRSRDAQDFRNDAIGFRISVVPAGK